MTLPKYLTLVNSGQIQNETTIPLNEAMIEPCPMILLAPEDDQLLVFFPFGPQHQISTAIPFFELSTLSSGPLPPQNFYILLPKPKTLPSALLADVAVFLVELLRNFKFLNSAALPHLLPFFLTLYGLVNSKHFARGLIQLCGSTLPSLTLTPTSLSLSKTALSGLLGNMSFHTACFCFQLAKCLFSTLLRIKKLHGPDIARDFLTQCFGPAAYPGFGCEQRQVLCGALVLSDSVRELNLVLKEFWDYLVYRESTDIFRDMQMRLNAKLSKSLGSISNQPPIVIDMD